MGWHVVLPFGNVLVVAKTTPPMVQVLAALLTTGEPEGQAKAALDEALNRVLSGLQAVEAAPPAVG